MQYIQCLYCTARFDYSFADKAMAMGVIQFAIGVFGNVPCPIIFGAAIDAACRLRDIACEAPGGICVSYDSDSLRHYFLGEHPPLLPSEEQR